MTGMKHQGRPFPDLFVDDARLFNLKTVFEDRFEAND